MLDGSRYYCQYLYAQYLALSSHKCGCRIRYTDLFPSCFDIGCSLLKFGQNVAVVVASENLSEHTVSSPHCSFFFCSGLNFRSSTNDIDSGIVFVGFRGDEVHLQWRCSATRHRLHELVQAHISQVASTVVSSLSSSFLGRRKFLFVYLS